MRITPTPRAISPQDIVRIYVPPPPPEELYDRPSDLRLMTTTSTVVSSEGRSPESDCRTIIQRTPTELPGSVSTATITSQSMRSFQEQQQDRRRSRDEVMAGGRVDSLEGTLRDLALYSSQGSLRGCDQHSTSSSRRGSMSRKSSMIIESELGVECPHIRISGGRDSRKNSLTNRHSYGDSNTDGVMQMEYEAIMAKANSKPKKPPRIMTSFEKLAQLNDTFYFGGVVPSEEGGKTIREAVQKPQQSDDEAFSYSYRAMRSSGEDPVLESRQGRRERNGGGGITGRDAAMERSKCTSDYNIQYKVREELVRGGDSEVPQVVNDGEKQQKGGGRTRRTVNDGGDVKEMMKKKKQYDRFFTPDESEEDDDDEDELNGSVALLGKKINSKREYRGGVSPDDPDDAEDRRGRKSAGGLRSKKGSIAGHRKAEDNSSSPSSSSGASKSLLTTPVNETQPLIGTKDEDVLVTSSTMTVDGTQQYNFKHSWGVDQSATRRRKHLTTDEDEDGYDDEEEEEEEYDLDVNKGTPLSSPTYEKMGRSQVDAGAYYSHRSSSYIPITEGFDGIGGGEDGRMTRSVFQQSTEQQVVDVSNKIRIRVNEKKK